MCAPTTTYSAGSVPGSSPTTFIVGTRTFSASSSTATVHPDRSPPWVAGSKDEGAIAPSMRRCISARSRPSGPSTRCAAPAERCAAGSDALTPADREAPYVRGRSSSLPGGYVAGSLTTRIAAAPCLKALLTLLVKSMVRRAAPAGSR